MKVTSVEKKEKSTVELTIQIDAEQFEAAVQKAYLKDRNRISVPGFRKGKAPRKIIEGMYGSGVFYEDAINDVYPDAYAEAVKEQGAGRRGLSQDRDRRGGQGGPDLQGAGLRPARGQAGRVPGHHRPQGGAQGDREGHRRELKPFIDRATRLVSVKRKAKKGDTAVIDFEGFDNGTPFEGGKGENYELKLGAGYVRPRL